MKHASISALLTTTRHSLMALVAIALLAACSCSGATALRNTEWELESLAGNGVLPGTTITLQFSGDQVSGSAGCNQYGGSYRAGEDSLSVRDVFWTEMGCLEPEGILEQERAYLVALGSAATYQLAADQLEIFNEAGTQILVFVTPTGDPTPTPQVSETPDATEEPETVEKLAPIDRVEILVAESFPPQYSVLVESGLPNGCVEFDRYEVTSDSARAKGGRRNED